jgi:hypothetical protein
MATLFGMFPFFGRRCSPTADIKDRNLRKRLQRFCRISTLKSPNVPIRSADLWSCQNAGSSSAPLRGSIAAEGSPRIGRISTEKRSRSCALPQSASCSENSAIRPEVSGRTLTLQLPSCFEVRALGDCLVSSAPEGPCDGVCGLKPLSIKSDGNAANFLD